MEKIIPHILIVDDDPNLLATMSDILKLKGFEPVTAQTGKSALAQLEGQSFDLALLDLRLEDMSGLKVLSAIKKHSPETECILLTGHASQNSAIEAIQMGVYGFFQKPFDMEQVLLSIQRANEKKQSVQALYKSEQRYRGLFEDTPIAIWEEDFSEVKKHLDDLKRQGITDFHAYFESHPEAVFECASLIKILDVNNAAMQMYRAESREELLESTHMALTKGEQQHLHEDLIKIAEGKTSNSWEGEDDTFTGEPLYVSLNWSVSPGHEDDFAKVIVTTMDVTQRKRAEEAVLESEGRFRVIFEKANDAIHIENADEKILAVNSRMCDLMGYSREELLNMHVIDLQAPEVRQPGNALQNQLARHGSTVFEALNLHRDGRRIPVEVSVGTIELPGGDLHVSVLRDITERKQAEEALRNSEKRFRALIENGRDNISLLTADGTLLWESPSTTSLMGYLPDQFVGHNLFELLHPEDRDRIQELLTQLVQTPGRSLDGVFRLHHNDGSWRWIEATASNLLNEPSVRAIVVNYRDITARKLAEEKIVQTEKRSQSLVENAPDGIVLIGSDGEYKYASPAAYRIFGYNPEETPHHPAEHTHPEDLSLVMEVLQDLIEHPSKVPTIQYRFWHNDGSWRWVESTFTNLLTEPSVEAIVINFRDITAHKQAEDKIRILSRALEQSPTSIVITDLEGNIEYVNPKFSEVTGYSLEEAIGENPRILKSAATTPAEYKKLWNTIKAGNVWQGEFLNKKKNGEPYWENAIITPVFSDDGNISNYLALKEDITERKQAQEAQQRSELQFRALFELSPDAVMLLDPHDPDISWPIIDCNSEACRINGYRSDELIGHSVDMINVTVGTPAERNAYMKQIQEVGNLKLETFHRHKNGTVFPVETSTSLINIGGRELVIGIDRDITERRQAQEAQQQSELQFRALFELSPDAVMLIDPYHPDIAWPIIDCNTSACQMNGYRRDELIGKSIDIVNLEPATLSNRNASIKQIRESGNNLKFETFHRHKNGVVFPIEVSTSLIKIGDRELIIGIDRDITERKRAENELRQSEQRFNQLANNIQEAFWITEAASGREVYISPAAENVWGLPVKDLYQSRYLFLENVLQEDRQVALDTLERQSHGAKTEMEYRIQHPDGSVHWIWDRAFPIFDETGKVLLITGLTADITERKLAEIEIKERTEELELINMLNEAVNRGDKLDKVMELFAGELRKISVCKDSTIYLLSPDEKHLVIKNLSIDPGVLKKIEQLIGKTLSQIRIPIKEGSRFQDALRSERGILITDPKIIQERILEIIDTTYLPDPLCATIRKFIPQLYKLLDIRSAMIFPLVSDKKLIGLLDVSSAEILTEKDLKRVYKISSQLTSVILREQANEALLESEERYRSIFDGVQDAIFIESKDGKILGANNRACEMYGYQRDEFLEKTVKDLVSKEDRIFLLPDKQQKASYSPLETLNCRANGELFPVEVSGKLQMINGEELMLVIVHDITERKKAEDTLRESEQKYRILFDEMLSGIAVHEIICDQQGKPTNYRFIAINEAFEKMTGLSPAVVIGETVLDVLPGTESFWIERYGKVALTREPIQFENYSSELGKYFEVRAFSPEKGKFATILNDITERKQAEEDIRQRVKELELLYESGLTFSQLLNPKEIAQKIIELLGEKLNWHHTAIRLVRAQDENLELVAFDQPGMENKKEQQTVELLLRKSITKLGEGLSGWALQQSKIVRSGDVSNDPRYLESYAGMHSGLYVPLKSGNRMVGVISIESEKPDAFNKADEQLLSTLGNQAANAFENARLFQTARQEIIERKRIESLLAEERNQLAQRVEERTSDLSRVNADLANAMRVKDEFLASMSHELRTPLTGILGLSEVLQLKIYGDLTEKQNNTVKIIEESGRHLLDLINDILDLSKIEAGRLELQFAPYSLADICQASLQLTKGMAQQKHQVVHYTPPAAPIIVQVDARRVKQLLVNLLSNAIKFTPENGELGLEIEANQLERKIKLTVWDKGIGIKPENLSKLFKPFTQLDSGLAREYSGTGLGLSLVQHLTEMHNGGIEVESIFGQGSRFTVILPWSPQNTTPIPYTMRRGNTGGLNNLSLPAHSRSPLVMYVDDNEMVLQMVADFLEAKQYRVVKVRSGLELLERASEYHPNIMLVDIQMPGIGGLETIRRIRAHPDPIVGKAPVIAVTALAMPADRERCLRAGANEYMSKPLKLKELATVIQNLLERK